MSIELVWRAAATAVTHHAFVLGDDLGEQEVRTACGLSFCVLSGEEVGADAEVTCCVCNNHQTPKILSAPSGPEETATESPC